MIASAAVCPPAPLLAPELTGRDPVVPSLREACAAAVARLTGASPEVIAVVGAAGSTAAWPADGRLDLGAFAPALGRVPGPRLPLSLGLGNRLLDEAGYRGPRLLQSVSPDEPGPACLGQATVGEVGKRIGRHRGQ